MLGLLGGLGNIMEQAFLKDGFWLRFVEVVEREYSLAFGTDPLPGTHLDYALPNAVVPSSLLGNFTSCT